MSQAANFGRQDLVSRLRDYLSEMSTESQQTLVRSIDRSRARGESSPVHALIMEALREVAEGETAAVARAPTAERSFFDPVEALLLPVSLPEKQVGRIERASLRPIWIWITRDLAPGKCDGELAALRSAVAEEDQPAVLERAEELRLAVCTHARAEMDRLDRQIGSLQKLEGQLGSSRILADLFDVLAVFEQNKTLEAFLKRVPPRLPAGQAGFDAVAKALRVYEGNREASAIYGFAAIKDRFGNSSDLVRFAVWHARTSDPSELRNTVAGNAISIVLSEASMEVESLRERLSGDRKVAKVIASLRRVDELISATHRTLDEAPGDPWLKRLAAIRARASELLSKELEPLLHLIKRVISAVESRGREIAPDEASIAEAVFGVSLFLAARDVRGSLALNALIERTEKGIENTLESQGKQAIDRLAGATDHNWAAAEARSGAAVQLFQAYFGGAVGSSMARRHAAAVESRGFSRAG